MGTRLFNLCMGWRHYWTDLDVFRHGNLPDWIKALREGNTRMTRTRIIWTRALILLLDALLVLLFPLLVLHMVLMVIPSLLATLAEDAATDLREGIQPSPPRPYVKL